MPSSLSSPESPATVSRRLLRHRLWQRSKLCRYCGRSMQRRRSTLDHVVAKANGGGGLYGNAVLVCSTCNAFKADKRLRDLALWLVRVALATARVRMGMRGDR